MATARVLVTGFNDWRDLGTPANVWRCRDNPSGRLLVGEACDAACDDREGHAGPLVRRLRDAEPAIEWQFRTMPVCWGVFASVPGDVDLIVNLGLGVYDRDDVLQLEAGAINRRGGCDAAGATSGACIDEQADEVLPASCVPAVGASIEALRGRTFAGYTVTVTPARAENCYLCNETHYHALSAIRRGHGRLREAYFLHLPYAPGGDHEKLAAGVSGLIVELARRLRSEAAEA